MFNQIAEFLALGGPVVLILALASVLALTISLIKLIQFWQARVFTTNHAPLALSELEQGNVAQARLVLGKRRHLQERIAAQALGLYDQQALNLASLQQELQRRAQLQLNGLQSHLRILEVIAMMAPLMGLFGTVLGMITAFQAMEAAGSQVNPSVLSGGIWKALMTTAAGLAVAIPVSVIHSAFERSIEGIAQSYSDTIGRLMTAFSQGSVTPASQTSKSNNSSKKTAAVVEPEAV